ncbi:MAG: transcriptional regulator [Candidatus Bathyarchaeota archaeon]|nr:transcriptional regulator [Candidatus Bathyarchaeota archaeon]
MKDDIHVLFDASEKMNGSAMSLLRCLILVMLFYYRDGLQYRELKSAFQISDGKLVSNLKQLKKFGYLEKNAIQFDNKKMTLYTLTPEGQIEVKKMGEWMESMIKIIKRNVQK